jgi:hypothetical protein
MVKALSIGGMATFRIWSPLEPLWWMERCGIILVTRLAVTGLGGWDTLFDVGESILESTCGTAGNGLIS